MKQTTHFLLALLLMTTHGYASTGSESGITKRKAAELKSHHPGLAPGASRLRTDGDYGAQASTQQFSALIQTVLNYTLEQSTRTPQQKSLTLPREDLALFVELAAPVWRLLVDHTTLQPLTTPPLLSQAECATLHLLAGFTSQQETLPDVVRTACAQLADACTPQTRAPGLEKQKFTASHAVADLIKRGRAEHSRQQRLDDTEHKKQQRFARERNILLRQEKRLKKHLARQKNLRSNRHATDRRREKERYTKESRLLRNRKYQAMKKESVANKKRDEYTTSQEQAIIDKKARHEAAREALQKQQ